MIINFKWNENEFKIMNQKIAFELNHIIEVMWFFKLASRFWTLYISGSCENDTSSGWDGSRFVRDHPQRRTPKCGQCCWWCDSDYKFCQRNSIRHDFPHTQVLLRRIICLSPLLATDKTIIMFLILCYAISVNLNDNLIFLHIYLCIYVYVLSLPIESTATRFACVCVFNVRFA
jgi:hypothetical protein